MVSQVKEPTAQLNIKLPLDLVEELDDFCYTHEINKKEIVELALRRFLKSERERKYGRTS